jgi:hypothetical protein
MNQNSLLCLVFLKKTFYLETSERIPIGGGIASTGPADRVLIADLRGGLGSRLGGA